MGLLKRSNFILPRTIISWKRRYFSLLSLVLLTLSFSVASSACMTDKDCRSGETCFKREKRASGICYSSLKNNPNESSETKPISGEIRSRAIEWLGDPMQIIEENLPNKGVGSTCIVSSDCPAESQCVLAGFEGRCVDF